MDTPSPMRPAARILAAAGALLLAACGQRQEPPMLSATAIAQDSVGRVRLGMTIGQAKTLLAPLILGRASDGDGLALVAAGPSDKPVLWMFAGEDDPAKPVNEAAPIEFIEVFSTDYVTADGIRPGMTVEDAATRLGKLVEVQWSEIESREFARFERQPEWLTLRVTGAESTAGVYPPNTGPPARTAKSSPGARILSVAIRK